MSFFVDGCSTFSRQSALVEFVLTICKISPDQQKAGQEAVNHYFAAVEKHEKPRTQHRYVAVRTLDPNPKQKAKYLQVKADAEKKAASENRPLGPEWTDPSQLHCIMVFDTQTREVVGSGCYVVSSLPAVGEVKTFEGFDAEYVGQ